MTRSRRVLHLLAVCAVLTVAVLSRGRQEGDAEACVSSGNALALGLMGKRHQAIESLYVAAALPPWLEREIEKVRKLIVSHPGLWLGLLAFCALAALVAFVRSRRRGQVDPYAEAGEALAREGKLEEACQVFAEALRLNPRNVQACANWALVLGELGRYSEACEMFAEALKIGPRYVGLYGDWALALAELGRYREACEKLSRVYDGGVELVDEGGVPLALVWAEMGQYEEACEKHAKAVEADPQDARAYLRWGIALGKLGRYDESCEKYAKAVKINPHDAEVYTNWGAALAELGRDTEACEKYAKAVEVAPRYAAAYLAWAEALARAGERAEASQKLNRAVGLSPDLKPQVEEIRKQLLGKE